MTKISNQYSLTNLLTADLTNSRIGVNNTNPSYSLDLTGDARVGGSLIVTGNLTAQQFIVSSSVTYLTESFASGSTKFGDSSDDNHNFTGSLIVSGSANPLKVGSNLLFVSSSGNVGIGTTNPTAPLSVVGNSSGYSFYSIGRNNADNASVISFRSNSVSTEYAWIESGLNSQLDFGTNGAYRLRINSDGTMILGGTSSSGTAGTGSGRGNLILAGSTSNTISFNNNSTSVYGTIYSDSGEMSINSSTFLALRTGGTDRIKISSAGNVGIGATNTPTYLLEVSTASGSQRIRVGTLQNNSNSATFEAITTASNTTASAAFFRANAGGSATIGVTTYTKTGGDSGNFANLSNQLNTVAIQITGGGSVLIGTETDKARLTVDGGGTSTSRPTLSLKQGDAGLEYSTISGAGDQYHGIVLRGYPSVAGDYSVTPGDYMSFYEYGGQFIFYKKQPGVLTQQVRFSDGVIYATNTTVQSISDIRTKENVQNSEQGLNVINELRPVRFDFKEEFNQGKKNQLGFIAQEVEEIFSDAVGEWKDDNDGITYKTVGPGALIPVLVRAIQELSSANESLKNRIEVLENK